MFTKNYRYQSHLVLHLIILFWAYTGMIGHILPWPAEVIVWYRMIIASFILGLILIKGNHFKKIQLLSPRQKQLSILGGLILSMHWWCFFASIKLSTVSIGLICLSATPFLTTIIQATLNRTRPPTHELFFSLLTISGLMIIFNMDLQYTTGILVGLLSSVLDAVFNIINGKLSNAKNPVLISWMEITSGFVLVSLIIFLQGTSPFHYIPASAEEMISVLFLGVICTALAIVGCLWVMKELSPYTVALTVNLEPVYGIILAVLIRGQDEIMPSGFYFGALLIMGSVAANTFVQQRRAV